MSSDAFSLVFILLLQTNFVICTVLKARVYLIRAPATIADDGGTTDAGILDFIQKNVAGAPVQINGTISDLRPKGKHGFHIHTFGDVESKCTAAGAHFNPTNKTHGAPNASVRHVGDLGNVEADDSGAAVINISDSNLSLNGPYSIIGRAVVVHEKSDDLGLGNSPDSKKTGNAGSRLICGVIGITAETGDYATNGAAAGTITATFAAVFSGITLVVARSFAVKF